MVTRIVIDTNIFVSVLIGQSESASRELLRECLQGKYQPLMGNALFAEYQDVINRDDITALCPVTDIEKNQFIGSFYELVPVGSSLTIFGDQIYQMKLTIILLN